MLSKINEKTVVERIVEQITENIIEGKLKPGDKIPTEVELINSFGVGRNSVREAIKMMSAMGILEIRRGDGTYISEEVSSSVFDSIVYSLIYKQSSKREILEIREMIEIDILEIAIDNITDEDITELEKIHTDFINTIKENNFEKAAELDLKFHFAIIDATRNRLLIRISRALFNLFFTSIKETLEKYQVYQGGHKTHEAMIEILKNKDRDRIVSVIKQSQLGWKKEFSK